jgi:hypothetical protein
MNPDDPERVRLKEARTGVPWRKWGPYLSERQWGTVREDYSEGGDAWSYLSHDQARSRAYRWGEDGIGGVSDEKQRLCVALALWNGRDPILKERLFGLTNSEGNHGEDVKEQYYYLDSTPTHSYMRMLYKYPQRAFPYDALVNGNRNRSKGEREYELVDTGIFDENRYFDVVVEYAKVGPDQLLMQVTAYNRGPEPAELHLLPHVWFRNTWSFDGGASRPVLSQLAPGTIRAQHAEIGDWTMTFDGEPAVYFCENETNVVRLYGAHASGPFKDGIHERVVAGRESAVSASMSGTKAAAHIHALVPADGTLVARAILHPSASPVGIESFETIFNARRREADDFYAVLQRDIANPEKRRVQRQALAGMLWSKQYFGYDVRRWLQGDPGQPAPPADRKNGRNADWRHFRADDVISMPDAWEYPWFAAWDLAFHCLPIALVDPEFAKQQLLLLTNEWYLHPNGQLPAYEWSFSDVNPPMHAWSAWRVFQADRAARGDEGDLRFLERVFLKLLLNFTWWVNRKDQRGNNIFQGGFLGLDNIGVFDRSAPLPTGGFLDQSDGTSWMAMYSLNMMRIALELSLYEEGYEDVAIKFFEHFLLIAEAMDELGEDGLWDAQDQFFYDWLDLPNNGHRLKIPLRVRSMVGLIPLYAVQVIDPRLLDRLPNFRKRLEWMLAERPELAARVARWDVPNVGERRLLAIVSGDQLRAVLTRMLDEREFLSPYGIRALSRIHNDQPFRFSWNGQNYDVGYAPAESTSSLFGGNSNWRGPIWMPVNYLLVEALHKFHHYYGDDFKVECPSGSGRWLSLLEVADELAGRLTKLFLTNGDGKRPVLGESALEQHDPLFRDLVLFYEYFDGDTGRGVGASHQTGWTGLVAKLIQPHSEPHPDHIGTSGERD